MSKKYVIEIKPEYEDTTKGVMVLGARDSNLYVDTLAVENLEELNSDYINEHFGDLQDDAYERGHGIGYQKGLEDGKKAFDLLDAERDSEYQRGFEDGKAVRDKGCAGCKYESRTSIEEPCKYCSNCHSNKYVPMPKQDDEIEAGDEVIYNGTTKCVVVTPETNEKYASLFDCNGNHYSADHRECKKTGRHFDISKILEDMRHD